MDIVPPPLDFAQGKPWFVVHRFFTGSLRQGFFSEIVLPVVGGMTKGGGNLNRKGGKIRQGDTDI